MHSMSQPRLPAILFLAALASPLLAQSNCMPGMQMPGCPPVSTSRPPAASPPSPSADPRSVTRPTLQLQEPEDPAHTTGHDLAAPELLQDLDSRPLLTLEQILTLAEQNNPTLRGADFLAKRSAAQARQAGLYPNPSLGYEGDQIRGGSFGGGEQGGYIQQTIVLGGKLAARQVVEQQQHRSDILSGEMQLHRVRADVARTFYIALTAQRVAAVRKQLLALALDAVQTTHQLANVGQADALDILQSEIESEQAKLDYVEAQRMFLQAFHTLAALAGSPNLTLSSLAGELEQPPQLDTEAALSHMLAESPETRRAQQQITVAEARLQAARKEVTPDLTVRAGVQYNNELLREHPGLPVGLQALASASIDLPLWNRNQGTRDAALAEIARERAALTRTQLALQLQAAPMAESYQSASLQAQRYRTELLPRADRAYHLYLAKYEAMASSYPQVIVAHRTLLQLQIRYLVALQTCWTSAIALQNFTLTGALVEPVGTSPGDPTQSSYASQQ